MFALMFLGGCAPGAAEAQRAASEPGLPREVAIARCQGAGEHADACITEVLRARPDTEAEDCARIQSEAWRAECSFAVGERHARAGHRWEALTACGQAGRYYHECLYHAWTYEIQRSVRGGGRAVDELETGRALVDFWGQVQTVGPDPVEQIWLDWWYFTLNRNPPADLGDCASLAAPDAERCRVGTLSFVERAIATTLRETNVPPRRKSRVCRGDILELEAQFPDVYRADDRLRERALAGRDRGCAAARGVESGRPWNPIFLENRRWSAG